MASENGRGEWPRKANVLGVQVSMTTYDEALEAVMCAAQARRPACVSHLAVHGLTVASRDPAFRAMLDAFEIVAPDGMPVKVALNLLYKAALPDRVYGPEFMLRVCERAVAEDVGVYLYGSRENVVETLRENLRIRFLGLPIVGCEPSLFRPLSDEEDTALAQRIAASGAGVVFVGLGCPLQEHFAFAHRDTIQAVQICVGAAFDFHAGAKRMAPAWMQRYGLEWLFRLSQEPGRLWRRYAVTNTVFLIKLVLQLSRLKKY